MKHSDAKEMTMEQLLEALEAEIKEQIRIDGLYLRAAKLDEKMVASKENEKIIRYGIAFRTGVRS